MTDQNLNLKTHFYWCDGKSGNLSTHFYRRTGKSGFLGWDFERSLIKSGWVVPKVVGHCLKMGKSCQKWIDDFENGLMTLDN